MALSLRELLAHRDTLVRQIQQAQSAARADAVARVLALMSEHELTVADLGVVPSGSPSRGIKIAPKFRDPASGSTWTGRGLKPKWLAVAIAQGKTLQDFAI